MLAHPTNFSSSSQSISSITSISNLIQSSPKKRKREQVEDVTTTSSTSSTIIPIPPTSPSPSLSNTSFHSFPRETTSPIITSLTPSPSQVGEFRAVGGHPVGKEVMGADRRVENQGDGEERDWEGRRNSNDYHDDTHVYDGREEEDDSKIGKDRTSGGQAEASTNGQNEIHQSPSSSATTQQQLSRHSPLPSLRSLVHSGDIYLESDIVHHQSSTQNHHHHPLQGPTSTSTPFSSTPFPIQRRSPNHPSSSISRSPPLLRPSLPASRSFSNQFNLLPRLGGLESGNPSFIMTSNRNTNNQSTSSLSSSHSDLGLSIARDSNHPYHLHRESSRSRDSIGSASRGSEDSSSSVHHQSQSIYRVRPSPDPEPEATERFIRSPGRDPLPIEHQSLLQRHQRSQSDAARLPYHREDITGFQSSTRGAVTNNGIDRESSTPSVLRSKYDSQVAFGDGWSSEVPDGMSGRPSGGSRLSKKKTPWVPTLPHQLPPSLNPSSANGSSSASRLSTSPPSTHRPEHAAVLSSMHQGNESSSPNGNHLPSNPIPINYHRSTNTEAEAERPRPSSNPTLIMPAANGSRAGVFYKTPLPTIDGGARGKVFLCDEPNCGKTFKRSEHLRRHQRSLHTNTRPYECQYPGCTKRFNRSDNLIQHQRLHEIPGSSVARNQAGGGTVKRKRGREARTVFIPASDKGIRYKWIEDPNDPTKLVQDFTHAARSSAHARQTFDSEDQGIGGVPSDRPQSLLQLQREQVQAASSNRPPQPSFLMEPPLPPDHRASRQRRGAQSPPRSRPPSTRSRRSADEEQKGEEEEASDEEVNKPKENFLLPMDDDDDDEEIELDLDEEVTRGYPVSNGVIRVGSRGENQVELQPYYPSLPNENQNGNEGDQDEMTFDDEDEDDGNGDEGMENDRQISADHAPQEEEEDPNINIQDGDGEVNGNSPVLDGSDEIAADGEVDGSQVTGKRRRISPRKSAEIQVSTRSTRSRTSRR